MTAQDFTVIVVIQIVLRSLYFVPRLETEAQSVCENLAFFLKNTCYILITVTCSKKKKKKLFDFHSVAALR